MRVILTGVIKAFRYVDLKAGKTGQIDLLQSGNDRQPTKVIQLYIPSVAYCRLILNEMQDGAEPMVSFLAWLNFTKEIEIDVQEILSIGSAA